MIWAPIALTAATSAMIGLSLAPALTELRKRRDASPLPTRTDDGHITNFSAGFRKRVATLTSEIDRCAAQHIDATVEFPDHTRALLIGSDAVPRHVDGNVSAIIFCNPSGDIPSSTELLCDVFANGEFTAGARSTMRALLAEGDIWLAEGATVCRWMHGEGTITIGAGSSLYGRLSSSREIRLAQGCRFERAYSPVIRFGDPDVRPLPGAVFQKRSIVDVKLGRLLATGDFHLASGDVLQGHVVASGNVLIDGGSRILGSVKSHGRTEIGLDTEIHGSMVSSASLHIAGDSFLRGPVLAEGELVVGPGTVIGRPDSPTTISAPKIRIAPGCIIHGTIWARYDGLVEQLNITSKKAS
jgi:cytoskeletal protein CcmA (bactofilin family)